MKAFCLWPSKYTEYTVANTPYKKDILGELVKAYNAVGIDVHFYFSVLDWSHPDWRSSIKTQEDSIAFQRFLTFTDNQLKELATRYPTVKDFWFDGTWDASIKQKRLVDCTRGTYAERNASRCNYQQPIAGR